MVRARERAGAGSAGSVRPLLRDRVRRLLRGVLPAWASQKVWPYPGARPLLLRRVLAGALLVLATCLALRPAASPASSAAPSRASIVVAARDLAPGTVLAADDVAVRSFPDDDVPSGALHEGGASGRTLAGAVRAGEPLTDVRFVGAANTRASIDTPGTVAVAVRLSDPGVASLLRPGTRVDVIAANPASDGGGAANRAEVIVGNVTVITVRDSQDGRGVDGKLVVLALPREAAPRVAAASLDGAVTVALR